MPFVAIAVARADTTVIGTAVQSSGQASTMSQSANNHVSPLPVVGLNHSKGIQTGVTSMSDSQSIPLGEDGVLVGKATQGNTQGAATTQVNAGSKTQASTAAGTLGNDQLIGGGGVVLGDAVQGNDQGNLISQASTGSKVATVTAAAGLGNTQIVGDEDGAIIGSPSQTSRQAAATGQSTTQKASNPTIGNSTLSATTVAGADLSNGQGVAAGTIVGSTAQGNSQGYDGTQTTKQSPAPVITGSYVPIQTTVSGVAAGNCQTVSDGSASCMVLP